MTRTLGALDYKYIKAAYSHLLVKLSSTPSFSVLTAFFYSELSLPLQSRMSQVQTRRTANPSAHPKPNYRALAGVEVEGQQARRTPGEMAAVREAEEQAQNEAVTTQQAILQHIAELEDQIDAEAGEDLVSQ